MSAVDVFQVEIGLNGQNLWFQLGVFLTKGPVYVLSNIFGKKRIGLGPLAWTSRTSPRLLTNPGLCV